MEKQRGIIKFSRTERVWFTADSHWGHRNIIKYCQRPFSDVEEMNDTLVSNWNKVVGENDYVFHLGDFSVGGAAEWTSLLDSLNGKIFLVLGNHDMNNVDQGFMRRFEDIAMQMLFPRQYDVGVDNNNYTPISFSEVELKIQEQISKSSRS